MIAVDTNILVYAHRSDSPWHESAAACIVGLVDSQRLWAIPWPCVHEFVAIVTHPRIYKPASNLAEASDQIDAWLECPTLQAIGEARDYWPVIRALLEAGRMVGPKVHDARIAAICQQHAVRELWSADRDFSRFPTLKVINPLLSH